MLLLTWLSALCLGQPPPAAKLARCDTDPDTDPDTDTDPDSEVGKPT
jgi:hypothetical protein